MARPRDQDGGWSWVVLGACSVCLMVTSGLAILAGIFQAVFLEELDGGLIITTWITSLFVSLTQLSGPVSGVVCRVLGCRTSVMAGGVLLTAGLVVSSFCRDVIPLLFAFGVSGGLGLGLIYCAAVVKVNLSFRRYRSLATGSVMASGGVGIMLMPVLCRALLAAHSCWHTLVMLGGLSAQLLVAGALLFPPDQAATGPFVSRRSEPCGEEGEERQADEGNSTRELPHSPLHHHPTPTHPHSSATTDDTQIPQDDPLGWERRHQDDSCKRPDLLTCEDNTTTTTTTTTTSRRHLTEEDTAAAPMLRKPGCPEATDPNPASAAAAAAAPRTPATATAVQTFWGGVGSVLTNRSLLLLCLQLLLSSAAVSIVLVHFLAFCLQQGSRFEDVSPAFSANGLGLTVGRFLLGALAQDRRLDPLAIYVGMALVTSLTMLLTPVVAVSPPLQICVMMGLGVYCGSSHVLITEITIHCAGVDTLSLAYGLEMVAAGLGTLVAPPLAGWLVVVTNSYADAIFFGGVMYLVSAIVAMLLSLTRPTWSPGDTSSVENDVIV